MSNMSKYVIYIDREEIESVRAKDITAFDILFTCIEENDSVVEIDVDETPQEAIMGFISTNLIDDMSRSDDIYVFAIFDFESKELDVAEYQIEIKEKEFLKIETETVLHRVGEDNGR